MLKKKIMNIASLSILGGVLISIGGILIYNKTFNKPNKSELHKAKADLVLEQNSYKELLKEAQTKYFDLIDKKLDYNISGVGTFFQRDDGKWVNSDGEFFFDDFLFRNKIFVNQSEFKKHLTEYEKDKINENGINRLNHYNESFFENNILVRVYINSEEKYIKPFFDKKTNTLMHQTIRFVGSSKFNSKFNLKMYEEYKANSSKDLTYEKYLDLLENSVYEKYKYLVNDEDSLGSPDYPAHYVIYSGPTLFVPFSKKDLKSNDLNNILITYNLLETKIDVFNFLKEEKNTGQF